MRPTLLAAAGLAAVAVVATTADAGAAIRASKPPCTPKMSKANGAPVLALCGPATLTLKVGGKSYSYRNGFCELSGKNTFELNMGTLYAADHAHNHGLPYFDMTAVGKNADVVAMYGGKDVIGSGMTLAAVKGAGSNTGSLTDRLGNSSLSASWNCHGVIVKLPS